MTKPSSLAIVVPLALSLLSSGCFVATARYEEKVAESDNLRDALAQASKEKNALTARNDSLLKQLADLKEVSESCAAKSKGQEQELSRLTTELAGVKRSYEGNRVSREELISRLMEQEKATGKRVQELTERALTCETESGKLKKELERNAKEIAARDSEIAEMKARIQLKPSEEAIRTERDQLIGKVERLTEDRSQEEKRRTARFESLAAALKNDAPAVQVKTSGALMWITVPEKGLIKSGAPELSDSGKAVAREIAKTLADFPSASVVVNAATDGKLMKSIVSGLVDGAKAPPERVIAGAREKDSAADLLLFVP